MCNHLKNRKQRVVINKRTSTTKTVVAGDLCGTPATTVFVVLVLLLITTLSLFTIF